MCFGARDASIFKYRTGGDAHRPPPDSGLLMTVVLVGGAGFVGLNLAEVLLKRGTSVLVLDRSPPPDEALAAFSSCPGRLAVATGDITDAAALADAMPHRADALVLGAAITAGPEREAADPEAIVAVNLAAITPLLRSVRGRVGRIVNLSSAAAYGPVDGAGPVDESAAVNPTTLYAVTKFASERLASRLASLWELDLVNVRLSGVFGPWERDTGVRDTLSPQGQVTAFAREGRPAILSDEAARDWIYATDVAEAVASVIDAPSLTENLFNVSTPRTSSVLDWGRALASHFPDLVCRRAEPGEAPTIVLPRLPARPPLATARLARETGWTARFDLASAAADTAARRLGVRRVP